MGHETRNVVLKEETFILQAVSHELKALQEADYKELLYLNAQPCADLPWDFPSGSWSSVRSFDPVLYVVQTHLSLAFSQNPYLKYVFKI